MFGSGGMPSSHSATVMALTTAIALQEGAGGSSFAISTILACVVRTFKTSFLPSLFNARAVCEYLVCLTISDVMFISDSSFNGEWLLLFQYLIQYVLNTETYRGVRDRNCELFSHHIANHCSLRFVQ